MSIFLVFIGRKDILRNILKKTAALSEEYLLDTVVSTTNKTQCINRPLQHIIPFELKDIQQ